MKQHLVGGFRNAKKCPMCPEHVREEINRFMMKKAQTKIEFEMTHYDREHYADDDGDENEDDVDCEIVGVSGGKSARCAPKRPRQRGPMDMFVTPKPKGRVQGKTNEVFSVEDKNLRDKACKEIARWFYDAGIAFNAATYPSFAKMIEAIGQYGPGMKPPSMHEIRVPLLNNEVEETKKQMEEHKKEWAQKGCSIMSDGWRDSVAQKDIVNFLVNSPKGSMFIKSMDVSEIVKDADLLFKMLDDMVEEVGEENVVQVVTDNASNYVKAGKNLKLICLYLN